MKERGGDATRCSRRAPGRVPGPWALGDTQDVSLGGTVKGLIFPLQVPENLSGGSGQGSE